MRVRREERTGVFKDLGQVVGNGTRPTGPFFRRAYFLHVANFYP